MDSQSVVAAMGSDSRLRVVRGLFEGWGWLFETVDSVAPDAFDFLGGDAFVLLLDEGFYADFLKHRGEVFGSGKALVVLFTEDFSAVRSAEYLASGVDVVLWSGLSSADIRGALSGALERWTSNVGGWDSREMGWSPRASDFSSVSPTMQAFLQVVERVIPSMVPLLILGETGVGKEWLARSIHNGGPRRSGPFVAVNCGALPEGILESELFGHEEGAFTGAAGVRRGHFEVAHGGTVFLDEIGEMPPHAQVKLLRVLQDHTIQRLGGEKPIKTDIRVIAATNRDLQAEAQSGHFRRDLYYRLSVLTLTVPPLRERPEDIPALIDSYIEHFRNDINASIKGISDQAMQALIEYDWPGNVRELINVIERGMILCSGNEIDLQDLPVAIGNCPRVVVSSDDNPSVIRIDEHVLNLSLPRARRRVLEQFEYVYLSYWLKKNNGQVSRAARKMGIRPRSLYDRMKKIGMDRGSFKIDRDP